MSFKLGRGLFSKPPLFTYTRSNITRSRCLFTRTTQSSSSHTARNILSGTLLVAGTTLFLVYYFDSRSAVHRYVFMPILRNVLDAEVSHKAALKVLRSGWGPKDTRVDDESLATELWGRQLSNPIGLAAGFDKDGEAIDGLYDLGFGWVEVGSVTPKPQPGNPLPRVFRLPSDSAIINRYGFPSQGHTFLVSRLLSRDRANTDAAQQLLSVNLGKNKSSPQDSVADFLTGIRTFAPLAPVLVINVSSPNTPGLRALQGRGMLQELLTSATKERDAVAESTGKKARLVLKIAPDLDEDAVRDLAQVVRETGVDGVIVSNTTISRPDTLLSPEKSEAGGLSGPPLKSLSLRTLSLLRSQLPASIPIIGCGGISNGKDALDYAKAGATAVQLYTAFGYDGVGVVRRIKDEVVEELEKIGSGVTWGSVEREARERLAWKPEVPTAPPGEVVKEDNVDSLIREAEELKKMLDEVAVKFVNGDTQQKSSGAGVGGGGSEEDLREAVVAIPPVM
ncbi:hypothetical protein BU17DRAFT_67072 [Hysterangium stoloniferum]|nr:hypothetical protein BU17DRAFT_67072 [Hysterangium stoloniferum]